MIVGMLVGLSLQSTLFGCLAIIGALGLKGFGASLILPRRCGSDTVV